VRSLPIQVRRPTHQETIRVHTAITRLVPYLPPSPLDRAPHLECDSLPSVKSESRDSHADDELQQRTSPHHGPSHSDPVDSDQSFVIADEESENWKSLMCACNKSQLPRLKTAVSQGDPSLHFIRSDGCTLLHIAAAAGSWRVVDLLIDAGVSPAPRDRRRKSAYDVSKDKATRDSFRKGM
jgi:hypothetical protein